mgnify:CR=1 FL=1
MTSKIFGYCRVSSKDQNLDRQIEAMKALGIDDRDIYTEKKSGKDTDREQYQALRATLREGDTLVIHSLDRLGRNYDDIKNEWAYITKEIGANIKVLDMPILDTTSAQTDLVGRVIVDVVLNLLGFVAQTEREKIRQRQAEGIKIAKEKGKYRKDSIQAPAGFEKLFIEAADGKKTHAEVMRELGLKKTTYYRLAKDLGLKTDKKPIGQEAH